jgi:hypothetical protein
VALQLAALAGNQFDTADASTLPRRELSLITVNSGGGGCCG